MSEDRRAGLVYSGSSGELVTAGDALGAPCWEPAQQERRRAATATALETLCSSLGDRQPGRIVDLGCGSGELTARIASLWPAADIVAVDQSDLMTLFTQGCALAAGHRNVRAATADAAGDLGIEPGTADLVVASCIANNMLNEIAGHCPNGDTDTVGYARWYHAWDSRPLPLLEQARRLLTAGRLLVSVEQNNHEFGIGAWGRMLARAGFTIVGELSHPIDWECDCGCRIPLSVLRPAGDGFDQALAAFLAWLSTNGHALRGGNLDLRPQDAAAWSASAGSPWSSCATGTTAATSCSAPPNSRRSWCMRRPPSASWLPAAPCPTSSPWSPAGSPTCSSSASCQNSPAAWRCRYWPRRRARKCRRSRETRAQRHDLGTGRNPGSPCPAVPSAPGTCRTRDARRASRPRTLQHSSGPGPIARTDRRTVFRVGERAAEPCEADLCGTRVPATRYTSRIPPMYLVCTWGRRREPSSCAIR